MTAKPVIGFVGQGYVGKNMADDCGRRGHAVVRYALEEPYRANKDQIKDCDIVFIAVPTPSTPGGFDASIVKSAISLIGKGKIAVIKSTVMPGMTAAIQAEFPDRIVLHSPEFLSEATAAYDAAHPHINIVGMGETTEKHRAAAALVHSVLPDAPESLTCSSAEAEIIKYVRNGNGYTQILFLNMMYDLATTLQADWGVVYRAIAADPFIPTRYAQPVHKSGRGAGGHCFIKDYAALRESYEQMLPHDTETIAVMRANEAKNIALLRGSGKDLDLLADVYGAAVLEGVQRPAILAAQPLIADVKLLMCTQSVDEGDPALGFFNGWLHEFARRTRAVSLVYLQGRPGAFPQNVRAFSLGKDGMHGSRILKRFAYSVRFLRHIWRERNAYDTVLVHINTEYVMLGGLLWRMLGKKVALLADNAEKPWKARVAAYFADVIFYTDPAAYVARFPRARAIPSGIETGMFSRQSRREQAGSVLFLGRVASGKRLDRMIAGVERLAKTRAFHLDIYGATILKEDEMYAQTLQGGAKGLVERGVVAFHGGIPHVQTPEVYAAHEVFVQLGSISGFHKTLYEAMAAGCLIVTSAPALRSVVNERLFVKEESEEEIARALDAALSLPPEERERERAMLRSYVEREHALGVIVPRILEDLHPRSEGAQAI